MVRLTLWLKVRLWLVALASVKVQQCISYTPPTLGFGLWLWHRLGEGERPGLKLAHASRLRL